MIEFWSGALALSILLYVLLDGFDLGVGMLFAFAPGEQGKREMLASIAPVWDGNETWLVCAATILFAAFSGVFAQLLSAFYLPLLVMLAGLIFRGMAFEFRENSSAARWLWDAGFVAGSYIAAFVQGAAVGALVKGLPVEHGAYVGGAFGWLSPFAVLCGVGLCIGYAMIGSCWIAGRGAGEVRAYGLRVLPWLMAGLLVFLFSAFAYALRIDLAVLQRWTDRPILFVFPATGAIAFAFLLRGALRNRSSLLFMPAMVIFIAAFATLAVSFLPYIVPYSITIEQAASPASSLWFLFWGVGLFLLPLTLSYNIAIYFIFRRSYRI